jgi:Flp pilus assembly protein TadD
MVLNNRGIVNYRLGNFSQARQDLENSIKLDHLNFLAYFNLFSINTLHEQEQAAFDNLSLALSSLNTTKCR